MSIKVGWKYTMNQRIQMIRTFYGVSFWVHNILVCKICADRFLIISSFYGKKSKCLIIRLVSSYYISHDYFLKATKASLEIDVIYEA